jgi:RNA 2',3'-cyclic 3'-phosphodiesterase
VKSNTHYFYAVSLPPEIKEQLSNYTKMLKEKLPFSRWVHHQDYHITLAFLGSARDDMLELSNKLVKQQVSSLEAFQLTIETLGFFGSNESPRIFWAGVNKEEGLHTLRDQVFLACKQAGFQLETRPFHPHITLARKWQGENPFSEAKFEDEFPIKPFAFNAHEMVLYQTHLERIPKYEAIEVYPLK